MSPATTHEWPAGLMVTPTDIGNARRFLMGLDDADPNPWRRKLAAIYAARLEAFRSVYPNL